MAKLELTKAFSHLASLKPISIEEADHDYLNAFLKSKIDVEKKLSIPLEQASILVVGCGYKYSDVLLFSCFAEEVYGLDILDAFFRDGFWALYMCLERGRSNQIFNVGKGGSRRLI